MTIKSLTPGGEVKKYLELGFQALPKKFSSQHLHVALTVFVPPLLSVRSNVFQCSLLSPRQTACYIETVGNKQLASRYMH
jgi:hypothetical protein